MYIPFRNCYVALFASLEKATQATKGAQKPYIPFRNCYVALFASLEEATRAIERLPTAKSHIYRFETATWHFLPALKRPPKGMKRSPKLIHTVLKLLHTVSKLRRALFASLEKAPNAFKGTKSIKPQKLEKSSPEPAFVPL